MSMEDVKKIIEAAKRINQGLKLAREPGDRLALARYKDMPKLEKPDDYHEKCKIIQGYYKKDDLFKRLVDTTTAYAANGHDWEVPIDRQGLADLKKGGDKKLIEAERQEDIWREWDKILNIDSNMLPGTGRVDKWIMKKAQLTGMSALTWKYGTLSIGDGRYREVKIPRIIVDWPIESVLLVRAANWEEPERLYVKKPDDDDDTVTEQTEIPEAETTETEPNLKNYRKQMSIADKDPNYGSFVIKYNWSPGDVTIVDGAGEFDLYRGLYPDPPYEACIPWLMMREAMCSSDLAILDGLINLLLVWWIGNEKYEPKAAELATDGTTVIRESDFEIAKALLEDQDVKGVLEVYLPHWLRPEFIFPPTETLTAEGKYVQATRELLQFFGVFEEDKTFFEQTIHDWRNEILIPFWSVLTNDTVRRNPKALTKNPNRRYNPLPFQDDKTIEGILKSHERGEISTETLHRFLGVDPNVERARVQKEWLRKDREVYDEMVAILFSQSVVKGNEKEIKKTTKKTGRPAGKKDEKQRKLPTGP